MDMILASFVAALDIVVFERLPNSVFLQVSPSPGWFTHAFGAESQGRPITLSQAFPFLDSFLTDAEGWWQAQTPGVLRSEPFSVRVSEGEVLLRATAVSADRRPLLGIERLVGVADPRGLLQIAREKDLRREQVERDLRAVRAALESAVRAADDLEADTASPDAFRRAVSRLRALTDTLPPAPPKR